MALFDWLSPKKKSSKSDLAPVSSGLSRMDSTRPVMKSAKVPQQPEGQPGKPANRKHERMARRELLYGVVRECMANAGVVSAGYKFKVLSLDARGRQFLVMVDLSREFAGDAVRLAEVEAMVAQSAKARFDIMVTAVYWRTIEHVATGMAASSRPAPLTSNSKPMPLVSQPAPLAVDAALPDEAASPRKVAPARFEPLNSDEVAAFKAALARGVSGSEALTQAQESTPVAKSFDGQAKHGPQSYTLLTGFEDTELPDSDMRVPQALSATQYGDLR
ncbi:hypothetical protein [Ramlibacter albus]|uniref:Uncharacterized protein n=1 Tax=Ramlibacter albus TaxID=2079448 RepID=A0A923S0Z6_9BURK|nr:hypothetical protein [Ramlibacter albus]MBC5763746.1 hypothetical protein [Ramlibacter albus]